ncbi:MAG: hypothetical protein KDK12_18270 [Rhodobacteraceae bacterium]|nr:hypothetical protein [Paracoccaceae bacterium]
MVDETDRDALNAEVLLALRMTTERETAQGQPWCAETLGAALSIQVLSLGPRMPGLAQQAVRLARVMEAAGARMGYAGTLYGLPILRLTAWMRALDRARGALVGIARIEGDRLLFEEPAMAGADGQPFSLYLTALSGIAAYLDMAHNMLGFPAVSRILAPALDGGAPADAVGRSLARAVDAWVRPRIETQHAGKQAAAMRRFLQARRETVGAQIDDAAVMDFWLQVGIGAGEPEARGALDGARTFVSAAELMLGFRRALRLAAEERAERRATGSGGHRDEGGRDALDDIVQATDFASYRSPLLGLATPPADRVNWAPETRTSAIAQVLGGPRKERRADTASPERAPALKPGLFAGDAPDLSLIRTVLRALAFGPQQDAASRQRVMPGNDDGEAGAGFSGLGAAFDDLSVFVEGTLAAAAHHLARGARAEALTLIEVLDAAAAATFVAEIAADLPVAGGSVDTAAPATDLGQLVARLGTLGIDDTSIEGAIGSALALATAGPGTARAVPGLPDALLRRLRDAAASHDRKGFKAADTASDAGLDALAAGAVDLGGLLFWSRQIVGRLQALDRAEGLDRLYDADRAVFHGVFRSLYGAEGRSA